MPIVRVALDVPLATLFDYSADESVVPGQRVLVPFGTRKKVGVVMERVAESPLSATRIKPVLQVLLGSALLSARFLSLLKFCSNYYHYPIGQAVFTALPTRLRADKPITIKPILHYRLAGCPPAIASYRNAK